MKTVILVIAEKIFRDEEYQVPKDVLTKAGFRVLTASTTTEEAVGKLGMKVKPDILVKDINIDQIDALVFVGGGGAAQYFNDPLAHTLANKTIQQNKLLAAICIAPVILAKAGVLKGKKATVFPDPDAIETLKKSGAGYVEKNVEVDGNIVTASGPHAAQEFGETLVRMLQ